MIDLIRKNKNNISEIIFCLYLFLPIFLLPISVLIGIKIYKILFAILNIIFVIISFYKNKKILLKQDIVLLIIILFLFSIDYLFRRNFYTLPIYFSITKSGIIGCYYYFRINDYKQVLKYLSIFSKISIVFFLFDPLFHYFYTTNYMGYGYAIMLPSFIAVYLYQLIESKKEDIILLIISFIFITFFANRNCILTIIFLILLTFNFLKYNIKNRKHNLLNKQGIYRIILVLCLFGVSFGTNYLIINSSINKDVNVVESEKNVSETSDVSETDIIVDSHNVDNIEDDNNNGLNFHSYSMDKYIQVLHGKLDRVFSGRFEIYKNALQEIKDNHLNGLVTFLFGLGTGYFMSKYDSVYTHFILFDLFIEYGVIGLIIGCFLLLYCIVKYINLLKKNDKYLFLFATFCLTLSFPKLLLSSYFQKEVTFFLFLACLLDKYPIGFIRRENRNFVCMNNSSEVIKVKKVSICKRCVMDDINTNITFDENGFCNYCTQALDKMDIIWHKNGKKELEKIIDQMKMENKNNKYDCVLGLSGGIDSCYTAYILSKYKVRMLAVHIDGGWNTDISTKNVKLLCEKLGIELHTIKVDPKEMYDLQRAYFMAEVINQDVPQDHVFFSKLYRYALKNNIKYFVSGVNYSSESILPKSWGFNAMDGKNLKDIHKKYGSMKLKDVKPLSFFELYIKIPYIDKLKKVEPLNYMNYNKESAIKELHDKIGFEYYGGKHCESVFTRLYQNYILPNKYGINKTKAHYSSLIVAGQMKREEALKLLEKNEYTNNKKLLEKDINEFINNINITREEFDNIMSDGIIRDHRSFKNYNKIIKTCVRIKHLFKK